MKGIIDAFKLGEVKGPMRMNLRGRQLSRHCEGRNDASGLIRRFLKTSIGRINELTAYSLVASRPMISVTSSEI